MGGQPLGGAGVVGNGGSSTGLCTRSIRPVVGREDNIVPCCAEPSRVTRDRAAGGGAAQTGTSSTCGACVGCGGGALGSSVVYGRTRSAASGSDGGKIGAGGNTSGEG